jgi:hypothetical protein
VLARPSSDTGWFRTNVLLARERVPAGLRLADLADDAVRRVVAIGNDVEIVGRSCVVDSDVERLVQVVHFESRRPLTRVGQMQAFVRTCGSVEEHVDLAQVVGTCRFDELDRYADAFATVVQSITFG